MRILAVVPARGGSKRLPGKNIRLLGGKPLIAWSIETVDGVPEVCDTLVSTDDSAIADVARRARALVPWLRPAHLATDTASSVDVAIHAIDWYESTHDPLDGVLLLQPTSPFRTVETVGRGIDLFRQTDRRPVVAVSPTHAHPAWTFSIEEGVMVPFMGRGGVDVRSQDLRPAYVLNGSLYLIAPEELRATKSFMSASMSPLVIDSPREALDIDTDWDWSVAVGILASDRAAQR